jgi:metal-responsive CopG/Arc/MetJ family transcriptional regulator
MPRKKIHENAAARVAAYRQRHALVTFSVDLPADLVAQLDDWMRFKGMTKAAVIEKLLRTQLLRKR